MQKALGRQTSKIIAAHFQVAQSWHLDTPAGRDSACQAALLAIETPQAGETPLRWQSAWHSSISHMLSLWSSMDHLLLGMCLLV